MHLSIILRHPWPGRYPRTRDIPWLMTHARINRDEVLWWRVGLKTKLKPQKLELIGLTDSGLTHMARLVRMFTHSHGIRTGVAIGLGVTPRFEHSPRRRIVLGSSSLIEALHEVAHARYGRSEAVAVAWSTAMFFAITQGDISKAHWHRHMLANEQDFLK